MEIAIIILLVIINGVFSMIELALVSARKSSLMYDAKKGSSKAKIALELLDKPNKFLSTIQIGITLTAILTGLFSGATLADELAPYIANLGLDTKSAHNISQIIIIVIVTYVSIVFGELIPKRIGMSSPETLAKSFSKPMFVLSIIASPFVWLLSKSTEVSIKILGIKNQEALVTEEEIKSMIAEGKEDGSVQEVEQDIVERVFSLGDRKVESIMTPRHEIVWIEQSMSIEQICEIVKSNLFKMYPVGSGSLDEIVGIVHLGDILNNFNNDEFDIKSIIQPANYFHEYTDVYKVLQQMNEKQIGSGLVCDEFGAVQGVVTHKDILEALVGTINDDNDEPEIIERPAGGWLMDGQLSFYDFLAHFEMEELYPEHDYNTIGGLVLEEIEHIPQSGESIEWNNFTLEVVDMDGARIDKILVTQNLEKLSDSREI